MKKNTLPKEFEAMLKELKRLDDEMGISLRPYDDKKEVQKRNKAEQRKEILKKIWDNWPRKTFLNKEVLQMRNNALNNPEIKIILAKIHVGIEDCALLNFWGEQSQGSKWDCPADCSPEYIRDHLIEWKFGNQWLSTNDYYWGGPRDRVKILFQRSNNNRFKVIGVIEMFLEKKAT